MLQNDMREKNRKMNAVDNWTRLYVHIFIIYVVYH